jgi:hypothetical protein
MSLSLICGLAAGAAAAQTTPATADTSAMYCSGVVTSDAVPQDRYLISGEESYDKTTFLLHDLVYVNRGSEQGVKEGDEYLVIRPESEQLKQEWFKHQNSLMRAMGTTYSDRGRIRVVHVGPKVSTAEIVFACSYLQRGDLVLPFAERPAPTLRPASLDYFAPPSGKTAMIVSTKGFGEAVAHDEIVYVNMGSEQGVQVGSYLRVFRYQGDSKEYVYNVKGLAYRAYGFGSTPVSYTGADLPRDVVGEGIVLRVTKNTATVMIVATRRSSIFVGDYVELESR